MKLNNTFLIDLQYKNYNLNVTAYEGDTKSRYIELQILNSGQIVNLTGHNIKVYAIKPDQTKIYNNCTITDAINGKAELELTSQMLAVAGTVQAQFIIYGTDNSILSTQTFSINVEKSLRDDNAIESTDEFTALTQGINKLSAWDSQFQQKYDGLNAQYASQLTSNTNKIGNLLTNGITESSLSEAIKNDRTTLTSHTTQLAEKTKNIYANKIHVCFGDSIMDLGTIPTKLADLLNCTVYNVGFAGCKLATTSGSYGSFAMDKIATAVATGVFTEQEATGLFVAHLNTLKGIDFNNVYSISIAYGTNDYEGAISIGSNTDTNPSTIKGAVNFIINTLLTAYPHLKITFVTPIFRSRLTTGDGKNSDDYPNAFGIYLEEYVEAIKTVCALNKVKCIDSYHNSGINKYTSSIYLSDGLHPNLEGDDVYSKIIYGGLISDYINGRTLNILDAERDYFKNKIGNLITDDENNTFHYPENTIANVSGTKYLTNVKTSTSNNLILARAKNWAIEPTQPLRLKGKLMATYTGNVRIDVTYYYKYPATVPADISELSVLLPVTANNEIDLNVILNGNSNVVSKNVVQTDIKIMNMSSGNVYVRNATLIRLGELDVVTALTSTGTLSSGWSLGVDGFKYKQINASTVFLKGTITGTFSASTMNVTNYVLVSSLAFKALEGTYIFVYAKKGSSSTMYPITLLVREDNTIQIPFVNTFADGDVVTIYFSNTFAIQKM